jgi:hypothetical protein
VLTLAADTVMVGSFEVHPKVAFSSNSGNLVARLMEVCSDGTVNQVSIGWLKASHYKGPRSPGNHRSGHAMPDADSCSTDPLAFQKGRLHPHPAIQRRQAGRDVGRPIPEPYPSSRAAKKARMWRLQFWVAHPDRRPRRVHLIQPTSNNPRLDGASVARANGNQDRWR